MTRPWSIGARLTLWYSLVLLVGLALFGAGIWLVVKHRLMASIDETLAAQAKGVATVLKTEYEPGQASPFTRGIVRIRGSNAGGALDRGARSEGGSPDRRTSRDRPLREALD